MYTGEREGFGNFGNKNAIKHEKGNLLDFLIAPSTPLKRIWPKPQRPLLDFQILFINNGTVGIMQKTNDN
jgi:hypothetical protein